MGSYHVSLTDKDVAVCQGPQEVSLLKINMEMMACGVLTDEQQCRREEET